MPSIDRESPIPFYQQVYEQIASGIESGLYPAGKKLPSIRECARELDVSNTTIELAYQKLTEEGYVKAKRGSGYIICPPEKALERPLPDYDSAHREALEALSRTESERLTREAPHYDFSYDAVDASVFPFATWARISRDVLFDKGAEAACLYTDRQGLRELRLEIAHYLGSEYGLTCIPEQILVMPTTRSLISEITGLFIPEETVFAIEEPGYDEVGRMLAERGHTVKQIPVVPTPDWQTALKHLESAGIAFLTPACQFPSNRAMPVDMREQLVKWAGENGVYVIDDEYGWEFQTGSSRIPPLAALDHVGRVITLGTFSNAFAPAICLSYAVLPPQLMLEWQEKKRDAHPQTPWQTQAAMAAFMRDGHWRAHIRKIRTLMRHKKAVLVEALEKYCGDELEVVAGPTSLFVLAQARDGKSERELVDAALANGVRVYPTSRYWSGEAPKGWRFVLVGYAGIDVRDIEPGIRKLAQAWFG